MSTRYVKSREGRGREEVEVIGCKCKSGKPMIVNVTTDDMKRSYCAGCGETLSKRFFGKSAGVLIPFGALVEGDRSSCPGYQRDPNEQY